MPTDTLSKTFAALADPTRRAILGRLVTGEATVTELAKPFEMTLPAVSKHLKVRSNSDEGLRLRQGRKFQPDPLALLMGHNDREESP